MSEQDLDQQREASIEEIKRAFPKHWHPKGKSNLTRGGYPSEAKDLKASLEGLTWQDAARNPHIIYYMSDPDYIAALTDRAYDYYLPAFLVATVNAPSSWMYYSFALDKLVMVARKSKGTKLDALVIWLEFQLEYLQIAHARLGLEWLPEDKQENAVKETLQKIHQLIEQKRSSS